MVGNTNQGLKALIHPDYICFCQYDMSSSSNCFHLKGLENERLKLSVNNKGTCELKRLHFTNDLDCGIIVQGKHRQDGEALSVGYWWASGIVKINDTEANGAEVIGDGIIGQGDQGFLDAILGAMASGSIIVSVVSDNYVPKIEIGYNSNVVNVTASTNIADLSITSGSIGGVTGSIGRATQEASTYTQNTEETA